MMKPNQKDMETEPADQRRQPGFGLIEVLITMLILVVGFLAMAKMQVMAISTNSLARDITKSTYLAQSRIEELLSMGFDDGDLDETSDYVEDTELEDSRFTMYRRVTDVPVGTLTFKKIDIKVEWGTLWKKKTEITVGTGP